MAGGDGLHNFPITISICGETKRGTFSHQRYKYVTNLSAGLKKKPQMNKLSISQRFPKNETLVLSHSVPKKKKFFFFLILFC